MATPDTEIDDPNPDNLAVLDEPGGVVSEALEVDEEDAPNGTDAPAEEDGEVVVTLEGEAPPAAEEDDPARAPEWLKNLRKSNREKDRVIREREAEIARLKGQTAQPQAVTLGPEPTMEDEDVDYDAAKFKAKFSNWLNTKQQIEAEQAKAEEASRAAQVAWQAKLKAFDEAKAKLKVPDFEDADGVVDEHLDITQRGILIDCAQNPAALKYALGKNPGKLKELAGIKNYAQFTYQLAQLETKLKVEPRRAAPPPERVVRGSGTLAGTTDKMLDQLRAEADKTGDRSKVAKYLREKSRSAA